MKALFILAAITLAGCEGMPQRQYNPNYVPLPQPYQLPVYQMPIQQQQYQKPIFCNTNRVGGTYYTNCQ